MKKIIILLFITLTFKASAQSNDYLVTMNGIGLLKIGLQKTELEKILNKKITLRYLSDNDSGFADTIKTKYKNIDVTLYLAKQYSNENKATIFLNGIRTSSPLCKTSSGIKIGDDKIKIITAYENDMLNIWPEYEDENYTRRSKTRSVIQLSYNDNSNTIIFYLNNKKVAGFEVTNFEGG